MPRCALVVDDVRAAASSIARALEVLGYETEIALGPRPAIESLKRRLPDVILLDINLPGVDGIEVCRFLRREPHTANLPIIAMSTENQPDTIARIRRAGANAFLTKPIDIDTLDRVLKDILPR